MRFLVDECTGPTVAAWLRERGHDAASIFDEARGADDATVLARAVAENRVLITADKGFGERIHRQRRPHRGVILLRLDDQRAQSQLKTLERLLDRYTEKLEGGFVVVNERMARFAR